MTKGCSQHTRRIWLHNSCIKLSVRRVERRMRALQMSVHQHMKPEQNWPQGNCSHSSLPGASTKCQAGTGLNECRTGLKMLLTHDPRYLCLSCLSLLLVLVLLRTWMCFGKQNRENRECSLKSGRCRWYHGWSRSNEEGPRQAWKRRERIRELCVDSKQTESLGQISLNYDSKMIISTLAIWNPGNDICYCLVPLASALKLPQSPRVCRGLSLGLHSPEKAGKGQ